MSSDIDDDPTRRIRPRMPGMDNVRMVRVGSWVTVQDGQLEEEWCIVAPEEANVQRRWMSEASPLARALLGHRAGDRVGVDGPERRRVVTILRVAELSAR